jgi:pimeloyl-ACP methyl ester carboxylesterase
MKYLCFLLLVTKESKYSSPFQIKTSLTASSHKQVRSFASATHNPDGYFQYFVADFEGDIIGLHGSDLLKKAAFVNEAIRVIRKLYHKVNPDIKVMILGHSYGGMIAKIAPLLSNHPNCAVSNLLMLGSPTVK